MTDHKRRRRWWRLPLGIAKWGLGLVLLAIVVGVVNQRIQLSREERLRPPPDQFVRVNGKAMHFSCTGAGPRTFVLDAGAGGWTAWWWRIQPALARTGRVCAYDRPGFGWSEPVADGHDAGAAADRLHAMVRAAKIDRPFILVGHSLGANIAQVYRGRYPGDVAALVLLEPGDPTDLLEDTRGSRAEVMAADECGFACQAAGVAGHIGMMRPLAKGRSFAGVREQYVAGANRPSFLQGALQELGAAPKTAWQTRDVGSFGDTPVLVFASETPREAEKNETPEDLQRWTAGQRRYLASLSDKSTRGAGLIVVPGADHKTMVVGEKPAAFVAARIVAFAEGLKSPPTRPAPKR